MSLSTTDLRELAARGSTLWERVTGGHVRPVRDDSRLQTVRLRRWVHVLGDDPASGADATRFRRRLDWVGWRPETVVPLLGAVTWDESAPLPAWTLTLSRLLADAPAAVPAPAPDSAAVPFVDVVTPVAAAARRALDATIPPSPAYRRAPLLDDAERALARDLATVCAPTLLLAWSAARTARPLLTFAGVADPSCRRAYDRFVAEMRGGGLSRLFVDYSALARLVATTTRHWAEAIAELCERLRADRALLQRTFAPDGPAFAAAVGLTLGLSDPHRGGRSVAVVRYADGRRLVYKPRGIQPEVQLAALLRWLNAKGRTLPLRALRAVDRGTHGWVEFAEAAPRRTRAAAARYAERMGALLAIHHALGGSDLHHGNVIGCGEHPVVVDAEALLQAELVSDAAPSGAGAARTVLQTGMLGQWRVAADGSAYDLSGITGTPAAQPNRHLVWEAVNTDRMTARHAFGVPDAATADSSTSDPSTADRERAPEFAAATRRGFARAYDVLHAYRDELLGPGGVVRAMARRRVRFLVRNTETYAVVGRRALHPRYLADGADRSIELDALSRSFVGEAEPGAAWPVVEDELAALEAADFPLFESGAHSPTLRGGGGAPVPGVRLTPALDTARRQLAALGPADRALQLALIHGAMVGRSAPLAPPAADARVTAPLAREEARRLATQIARAAVRTGRHWMFVSYAAEPARPGAPAGPYALRFVGDDLYDGRAGIALFLAAVARVCADDAAAADARALLRTLGDRVGTPTAARAYAARRGVGAGVGLGGVAYALARGGVLLDDARLTAAALVAARAVTMADRRPSDRRALPLDVLHGGAGAALALLGVHAATGAPEPLARAAEFGRHLLAARAADHRVLPDVGFAHGRAGVHHALLRLYRATGHAPFRDVVAAALEKDVGAGHAGTSAAREASHAALHATWCHDGTGAALAQVATLDVLDTPAVRATLTAALDATRRAGPAPLDHLCCGTLGRSAALAAGAGALGRDDLGVAAEALVAGLLARARARGRYTCFPAVSDAQSVGFFQGVPGIGYELLRMTHPGVLPAVALWE